MDSVNFKNGPKNQWRRQAWNAIRFAIKKPPGECLVLYLPGSTDLDRAEAVRRGFKPANMIAIERDTAVVSHLRRSGITTIAGQMQDVLASWPVDRPIDVVIADLQCGMSKLTDNILTTLAYHPATVATVALVNLQRGRDQKFWPSDLQVSNIKHDGVPSLIHGNADVKSRAKCFAREFYFFTDAEQYLTLKSCSEKMKMVKEELEAAVSSGAVVTKKRDAELDRIMKKAREQMKSLSVEYLPSYRSTPKSPLFDSAVLSWAGNYEFRRKNWGDCEIQYSNLRLQIAAALAIRARRLRGELGGALGRAC